MSRIEWQETLEFEPPKRLIRDFCQASDITLARPHGSGGTLVFVVREALQQLNEFLLQDLNREHGGVLLGQPLYDPEEQRYFVVVQFSVAAKGTEGSPVHLHYTASTWDCISRVIDRDHRDMIIVGWYHSHPGLGVFMSSADRATQRAFGNHPWTLAVVVDPIAQQTGWFAGEECIPLDRDQVVMYEEPAVQHTPAAEAVEVPCRIEEDSRSGYSSSRSLWLLPLVGLTLAFAAGAIWFLRKGRFRTRASSS